MAPLLPEPVVSAVRRLGQAAVRYNNAFAVERYPEVPGSPSIN